MNFHNYMVQWYNIMTEKISDKRVHKVHTSAQRYRIFGEIWSKPADLLISKDIKASYT